MTRLSTYRQKQFRRKVLFYVFTLALIIILLFTFGLKLLIQTSLIIANIASPKKSLQTQESKDGSFFGALNIDNVPTATNSARLIVSGSITNYDTVEFYINDKKVDEKSFSSSDSFSSEIGDLEVGDNIIYLKAKATNTKDTKESQRFTVTYKNQKPTLEITEPETPKKTNKPDIKVSGQTDKEIFIHVNEMPLVVDSSGNFQTTVMLKEGENNIIVKAEDNAGNIESKTLTITYQKDD